MASREKLWEPSPERAQGSRMHRFMQRIAEKHGIEPDWEALRVWSIEHRGAFWSELIDYAGIEPSRPASAPFEGEGMLGTRWFPGMTLNYAGHMLRHDNDEPALYFENERGQSRTISHRQLRERVAKMRSALEREGVKSGDRVAGYMPNMPETVIAMLAAASLGASWSSCSPDFGVGGVLDRFGQIEPTVLIAADGYTYNGKPFSVLDRIGDMLGRLPSIRRVVVVPHLDEQPDITPLRDAVLWDDYLGAGPAPELTFTEVPFDHPLFIMFSSGTTGKPKCIVHGHGGTLVQHMKELMLHTDLRAGERIMYFTTCGWMMWNWLVSSIGVGACVVLYEGSPAHPDIHRLWSLIEQQKIHVFGTSPKFIAACQNAGIEPAREHDLSSLRAVLSTGAPLTDAQFRWIYEHVKADVQLSSICGGTDIISCFFLGNPMLPVFASQAQCRGLGMDVQAWTADGRPVLSEKAELVCCTPFPSQPVCFWDDPDGSRYRAAYFEHFPPPGSVWRHGDFIEITDTGGVIVYGRSDATLNPGGVRIGTAEIYRIVEEMPEVTDSIVVGVDTPDDDVEIALFVVLREGVRLDGALTGRIKAAIAAGATRRHVPRHVRQISGVPQTVNGKKTELAVRQVIRGENVTNRDALANPSALDQFKGILG